MKTLFSEFTPSTAAEWKAQLAKDLKGDTFESLTWKNENGFDIHPFYTSEDLNQNYEPAFTHADWDICVSGKSPDAKTLNQQLLQNLSGGATAISIRCSGLDLESALAGIQLNYIHSTFYIAAQEVHLLHSFLKKNYKLEELNCSVFPEHLGSAQELENWMQAVSVFNEHVHIRVFGADALPFHNQNCFAYYEVAVLFSMLLEYLNARSENKTPASRFVAKSGVSSDYFIQIAKLRAIRRLWKLLAADYKIQGSLHLIVETGATNKSISDPYNNLLRTTIEAMAGISGGCNELIVTEFDLLVPTHAARAERIAINQQLILKEESYFNKMADTACGSYYIESLTDALAAKALETLKSFEAEGGYFKCLEKQRFSEDIRLQAKEREERIFNQDQAVVGVNKFRNEKEKDRIESNSASTP